MNPQQHCTHIPHRQSPPSAWPLRGVDGKTFAERKAERSSAQPICGNCAHWQKAYASIYPMCTAKSDNPYRNALTKATDTCSKFCKAEQKEKAL